MYSFLTALPEQLGYVSPAIPREFQLDCLSLSDLVPLAGSLRARPIYTAKSTGAQQMVVVKMGYDEDDIMREVGEHLAGGRRQDKVG